jgi:phospho-N-acetylmuramoyl-pentapeptide-transferase
MFYYLYRFSEWYGPLRIFESVTFRAMAAGLCTFCLCLWMGPMTIRILRRLKLGQPIRGSEEVHKLAELHGSKKGTPTMGGMMILLAMTMSSLVWVRLDNLLLWVVLIPTLGLGLIGFLDDFAKIAQAGSKGISGKKKMLGQIIISVAVGIFLIGHPETSTWARSLQLPFLKNPVVDDLGWMALVFFSLVIVGSSNAVNLTDGLDGLAVGCTLPATAVFAVFAYLTAHAEAAQYLLLPRTPHAEELAVFCAAMGGACGGFLWFNCHPAKMFMGDVGSLAIGGALAMVSICLNQELLLVIVGGVFVAEALSVILQVLSFKLTGRRIFAMSPIHHHFELKGWNESTVVVRFWIMSIVCALLGLATLKLR